MASETLSTAPSSSNEAHNLHTDKQFNTLILDSGPIIKNNPTISTLLAKCNTIVTIPEVIAEIRDAVTRARIETTLLPFLQQRSPKPDSVKFVIDFARRTGDLSVLSKTDLRIIALAYEIECELNGGDWRLKKLPGRKDINGPRPAKSTLVSDKDPQDPRPETTDVDQEVKTTDDVRDEEGGGVSLEVAETAEVLAKASIADPASLQVQETSQQLDETTPAEIEATPQAELEEAQEQDAGQNEEDAPADGSSEGDEDEDDGGWITPGNIGKFKARDAAPRGRVEEEPKHTPVATLTTDFAMQNVLLQINLNLVSDSLYRVRSVKTFALRCYACFQVVKDMSKQFCPRCGKPSLTRVSCSTDSKGGFQVHLKKNFKLNTRGDRFSIPKPVTGSASGRIKNGGGTGGWGAGLILAEDQKEYTKAVTRQKRIKEKDLMDEDYLPNILTGARSGASDKIKVGAGRSVNSTRRKK